MPALIVTIAGWFGISPIRIIVYAVAIVGIVIGAVAIRHHFVAEGYSKAIIAVKKQDDRAVAAADKVQQRADDCTANSWWDVISQSCKLEEAK